MKNLIATLILTALIPTISSAYERGNVDTCPFSENGCVVIQKTLLNIERFVSEYEAGDFCRDEALLLIKGEATLLSGRMGYGGPTSPRQIEQSYRAVSQYLKPYFMNARLTIQSGLEEPSLQCEQNN